MKKYLAKVQDM
jgi:ribonuclease HI